MSAVMPLVGKAYEKLYKAGKARAIGVSV
eukprot:COSAG01_NODE_30198_length_620_cov_191.525912_1_plen_28_part_10